METKEFQRLAGQRTESKQWALRLVRWKEIEGTLEINLWSPHMGMSTEHTPMHTHACMHTHNHIMASTMPCTYYVVSIYPRMENWIEAEGWNVQEVAKLQSVTVMNLGKLLALLKSHEWNGTTLFKGDKVVSMVEIHV